MKSYIYNLKGNPMKYFFPLILCCLFFFQKNELQAQCDPDVTPPIPICENGLVASLNPNGQVTIWATDIDEGSYDECTAVEFYIEEGLPPSPNAPATQSLDFDTTDIGMHDIILWVVDSSGNDNYCVVTLEIQNCQGTQNLACNDLVQISLGANGTAAMEPDWILEGGPYCSTYGLDFANGGGFPGMPTLPIDTSHIGGPHTIVVYDTQTGNSCWGSVLIYAFPGSADCNPDVTPPVAVCDASTVLTLSPITGLGTLSAQSINDGSYDNCVGPLDLFIEEGFPPSPNAPSTQSLTFDGSDIGMHDIVMWVVDQAGNENFCAVTLEVQGCPGSATPTCNASQTIGIPPSGSVEVDPLMVLEGGPYCNGMGIDFLSGSNPPGFPFITLDTSHIGTTQQVIVYDVVTGNSCWGDIQVIDCQNDMINPVAVCVNGLVAEIGQAVPHELTVWGTDFDDGSYDNCSSNLEFRLEETNTPSTQAPTTTSLTFNEPDTGLYDIVMWVIDDTGNENFCATTLEVLAPDCNNDNISPICIAPANTSISQSAFNALSIDPQDDAQLATHFGYVVADDNCGVEEIIKFIEVQDDVQCGLTNITRTFAVKDTSGNLSQPCKQVINLYREWSFHIPADFNPGDPVIDSLKILGNPIPLMMISHSDNAFDVNCDSISDYILRSWSIVNFCESGNYTKEYILPKLDINNDGNDGDGYDISRSQDSVYLLENGQPTIGLSDLIQGSNVLLYFQHIKLNYNDTLDFNINGTVFHDSNDDCNINSGETNLAGWPVTVTGLVSGNTQTVTTDTFGHYSLNICNIDTLAEVSLDAPFNYGPVCGTTYTVQFTPGISQDVIQDIPVSYDTLCPILWVDISTRFLRRCFENTYTVNYCNYSDATIDDMYVEVQLDPFMTITSSDIPGTPLGGNLHSFDLGDIAAGECGNFKINFYLDCSAALGATHCVNAHIYPDTLCPNPTNWSGANIEVEALCENDTVFLSVKNTGTAAMAGPLEYIVVEDVIMLQIPNNTFDLGIGEMHSLTPILADGSTYRIEAEQEPGHPYPGDVAAAVEGCNGINLFGLVNLFPMENPNPFIANDCQQNVGSFDPNDKQAFPTGYGDEHYIEQNTAIDYLIRFQNTGTDTAFKVVIIDELDPALEPASIRPGASSHDYQFELINGNTLRFTFHDIMLPDSNINEPASHGFVKFKAFQKPDQPLGTVIENEAAIYFDFNDPVITNTVFHTLGDHFIEVINDAHERPTSLGELLTYPNPSLGDVTFQIPDAPQAKATFILHDALGKQLVFEPFSATNTYRFERGDLVPGVYFYKVEITGLGMYTGKIILK